MFIQNAVKQGSCSRSPQSPLFGELLGQQQGGVNYIMFIVHGMLKVCSFKNVVKQGSCSRSPQSPLFGELLGQQQGGVNYRGFIVHGMLK
eukprot:4428402-Amphidinium_carterae.1